MVKNAIKVYGRIKRTSNTPSNQNYVIRKQRDFQEIVFNSDIIGDYAREYGYYKSNKHRYRFFSVFDEDSTQADVFDIIAKPVVNSVLEGYNGTIFAYGQTGSGKTYSMTGASEYETRGIIPRTIQYIFQHVQNSPAILYNIYISYLEIYNEIGYDLLNPKHRAAFLEDLPRVTTLEDAKGQIHLRNLGVISVASEREAMCLLFLGDTNRTIAETPMNMYSSRSHCIFTVYVAATLTEDGRVRRSKLHLVDLAGSERIQKSCITGNLLIDARQINLSLHYLEQVIIALSDEKRSHVPYRNSLMTSVLRDSLGGNCLTTMLATLSADPRNFEETISTCKFAQRVALVSSEVYINEDEDPEVKIGKLEMEIENLKKELVIYKGPFKYSLQAKRELTPQQIEECENQVSAYIRSDTDDFPIEEDISKTLTYFKIFKRIIKSQMEKIDNGDVYAEQSLVQIIKQKDNEISNLSRLLSAEKLKAKEARKIMAFPRQSASNTSTRSVQDEKEAFELFMRNERNKSEMDKCAAALRKKIAQAKTVADRIRMCKDNIMSLKVKVRENINNNPELANRVMTQLQIQQDIYRETIMTLSNLKTETEHLSHSFEQERLRTLQRFKNWYINENRTNSVQSLSNTQYMGASVLFPDIQQVYNGTNQISNIPDIQNTSTNTCQRYHDCESGYVQFPEDSRVFEQCSQYPLNIPTRELKKNYFNTNSDFVNPNPSNYYLSQETDSSHSRLMGKNLGSAVGVIDDHSELLESSKFGKLSAYSGRMNYDHHQHKNIPDSSIIRASQSGIEKTQSNDLRPENVPEKLNDYSSFASSFNKKNISDLGNYSIGREMSGWEMSTHCGNMITEDITNSVPSYTKTESEVSQHFLESIPLTGDPEVDEEIIAFYRAKDNIITINK